MRRRVGDFTSVGLRGSLIARGRIGRVSPYGYAGIGAYAMSTEYGGSVYEGAFKLHYSVGPHAGFGLERSVEVGGITAVAIEVEAVAVVTDYGAGDFEFPIVHYPLTVGIRF